MLELSDVLKFLLDFFDSPLFLALQILGGLLSLAMLAAIIVLIKRGGYVVRHIKDLWISWNATPVPKHKMAKRWTAIKKAMEGEDAASWRSAILGADSMLDEVVVKLGYKGETLEGRLENIIPEQFPSLENAWRAHQISEFLKEDPSYELTREVADQTVEIYRSIFRETGIIL